MVRGGSIVIQMIGVVKGMGIAKTNPCVLVQNTFFEFLIRIWMDLCVRFFCGPFILLGVMSSGWLFSSCKKYILGRKDLLFRD